MPAPSRRPVVLTLVDHYLPGFKAGGVLRTIANMVDALSDDFEFRVVTRDRDLGDEAPYPGISGLAWEPVGRARVWYLRHSDQRLRFIARLLLNTPHDILHLNSVFDPVLSIRVLTARRLGLVARRPVIVAPRGELGPGSFAVKKPKKVVFLRMARAIGLHEGVMWHASTTDEEEDIRHVLGQSLPVRVAPDLPSNAIPQPTPRSACGGPLAVIYLGRVSREKNLDYALRVLRLVRKPMRFHVHGPLEDSRYWEECQALIAALPSHVQVTYRGSVLPADVAAVLGRHDLLFLPSTGENYGHVIVEAWRAGIPALISDRTPWHDLQRDALGWEFPLARPEAFANALDDYAAQPAERRAARRSAVITAAAARLDVRSVVEANAALFREAIGEGAAMGERSGKLNSSQTARYRR